ncbi:hypothetical protein [Agarilytica rhodophyticola]|uniref:hypothetical protein n=1 Tax=Agarilytica rhodophyticola TaxID=1737490 RepID=UPI0013153E7A|nr:hypothetical protein [Agarilytica rhodophyticola]
MSANSASHLEKLSSPKLCIAIEYTGDNVEIAVPALLIIGKSSGFMGRQSATY